MSSSYINAGALLLLVLMVSSCNPRIADGIRKNDLRKDVALVTDSGTIVLRLSDSTPLHRDNFIRLVNTRFYEGVSFHRVINGFMIQAGDPRTKPGKDSSLSPGNKIPAEIRESLFHKKGVLAAAREGDATNPAKASSPTQFYLVQGRVFSDKSLDSTETFRLKGRKIPAAQRQIYKSLGGAPHLDQNYTIYGEVISGLEIIDKIASVKTSGKEGGDKPLNDVRIKKTRLIRRK
ncbi:MAG: peptidylprolyl isomerase [Sphingobacteriales bacterium]|nr:MAG: peptidylprolyl isomerase [Sphingobacteriales bacterium]